MSEAGARLEAAAEGIAGMDLADRVTLSTEAAASMEEQVVAVQEATLLYKLGAGLVERVQEMEQSLLAVI